MTEYPRFGIPKDVQLGRSPGNRKKPQSNKAKGEAFEKEVQAAFQKGAKNKVRRNHQGRAGGGMSNPDVSAMPGWFGEAKAIKTPNLTEAHKQIEQDCPIDKKPMIFYKRNEKGWISIELERIDQFAQDRLEQRGAEVYFPE